MIKYLGNINPEGEKMKYEEVWNAVDKLAQYRGLSASGLAKLAGLDATTFNKSKRIRPDGKNRWPSLDSINKILEVCNISFEEFYRLNENNENRESGNSVPFTKFSKLSDVQSYINKNIDTSQWKKVMFPDNKDNLYAVEIDTNDNAPIYKNGTMIMIASNSDIRRNDRVIIFGTDGSISINEFIRRSATKLVICDINNSGQEIDMPISNVKLINRIVWASQ